MLTWRWGGAILVTALVAGGTLLWTRAIGHGAEVDAGSNPAGNDGLVLVGYLTAPGIALARCEARCSSMRLEPTPVVQRAEIDPRGRFEFRGLADVDYRVEVVLRANPALVIARAEFVRPGGEECLLTSDPTQVFGPAGSSDPDSQ